MPDRYPKDKVDSRDLITLLPRYVGTSLSLLIYMCRVQPGERQAQPFISKSM